MRCPACGEEWGDDTPDPDICDRCHATLPPPPAFPATYASSCIGCGHGIRVGDPVRSYEEGYVHAHGCPESLVS